jgi:S-formylglutathione hydrolase
MGITGHSMGGHGALTLAMKHPHLFRSVSAFAPISSAMASGWGQNVLPVYLGDDAAAHQLHDATALMASHGWKGDMLVDQGLADAFLDEHLKPHLLAEAAEKAGIPLTLRQHSGYDHSYYFVASFMADHITWHANRH